jgi:LytS/YehU family sensor histidine kinase
MKQSRQENIFYLIVWGLLFVSPLLSLYVRTVNDSSVEFDWSEVFFVFRKFAVYLVIFLIHNFLLAPMLVHRHRRVAYFSIVTVVIALFAIFQCSSRPDMNKPMRHRHPMENMDRHRPPHIGESPKELDGKRHAFRPKNALPPIVGERDIMAIVVLILMLGGNLGIKYYFRSRDDHKRLAELEHKNLEQQLEYLRYQINPHFFMNTLNNIHALVDIDPEKAKDTILELSKMMRFVLYEGNKQGVPLSREMDFIRHYITLMQLRYTDKVHINVNLPSEVPDCQIPPLILITFIENAFKHGITYKHESFISIEVAVEKNELQFSCLNSKADSSDEEKGGVGLANVRKRLDLLYGRDYTLSIDDTPDVYSVRLVIPFL